VSREALSQVAATNDVLLVEHATALADQGDVEAVGVAYALYHDVLERVMGQKYGLDRAEDIVHDTFVKAMVAIPEGKFRDRGKDSLRNWLFRVAHNASVDQLRREKPAKVADGIDVADDAAYGAVSGSQNVEEEAIMSATAREMLQQLDDEPLFREALVAMGLNEEHYADFAARKGISPATARTRLHRARTKLRERLNSEG
jgi:RNA polymerase sigma-70 factor (ECF subfamily)